MTSHAQPIGPEFSPDPAVWETLRGGLRIMALKRLRDAEAAEEAVQEVLARTLQLLHKGRIPNIEELAPIAFGIARHVLADETRKNIRARRFLSIEGGFDPPPAEVDVLAPLIAAEERAQLRRAWWELASADREILRLTFVESMEPGEVAARLGEPPERIRKRKSRALARLRERFFGSGVANAPDRALPSPVTSAQLLRYTR